MSEKKNIMAMGVCYFTQQGQHAQNNLVICPLPLSGCSLVAQTLTPSRTINGFRRLKRLAKETSFKSFVENVAKSYTIKDFDFNVFAVQTTKLLFIFSVLDWN